MLALAERNVYGIHLFLSVLNPHSEVHGRERSYFRLAEEVQVPSSSYCNFTAQDYMRFARPKCTYSSFAAFTASCSSSFSSQKLYQTFKD